MDRRTWDDSGTTHLLEAVIVSLLMVSSVAYVVTFDAAPAPGTSQRLVVEQRAADVSAILYDTPAPPGGVGSTLLSRHVLECLQDACGNLTDKLDRILPPGAQYALTMANGRGNFPLVQGSLPAGEAISTMRLFEPEWSFTTLATGLDTVNPGEDPLVLYALPVFNSNPLAGGGSALTITVHGSRNTDGADFILRTAAATHAPGAGASEPATSLYFVDGTGAPIASRDVRTQTLSLGAGPSLANVSFALRVQESAGHPLPAGTTLTLHMPRGWTAAASPMLNPGWKVMENATSGDGSTAGSTLRAQLVAPLSSGFQTFAFRARYVGDPDDYHAFRAELSRGGEASASLLVLADAHANPTYQAPALYATVPRNLGAGATTTWALAALLPTLTEGITVREVVVEAEGGELIFGSVTGLASAGGAWQSQGHRLVWSGAHALDHHRPLNLTFQVGASGVASPTDLRARQPPLVTFDGKRLPLMDEVAPGLYRGVFLPASKASAGYNDTMGGLTRTPHTATSTAVHRSTPLPGSVTYGTSATTGIATSLLGSDVHVRQRNVPVGGQADVGIQVQALLYELAVADVSPRVDVHVYAPWDAGSRRPVHSQTLLDEHLGPGGLSLRDLVDTDGDGDPDPTDVGRYNLTFDIDPAWLFGPYLVEVEVWWTEDVETLVGGSPVTSSLVRRAHAYDYFLVTPPDGLMPASPIYDFRVVAWMPDWK